MKLFHVYSKAQNRYLILAKDESDAIEVAYINGCVRNRANVVKLVDITKDYMNYNPNFDPNSLSRGELLKGINGMSDTNTTYTTYLKEQK